MGNRTLRIAYIDDEFFALNSVKRILEDKQSSISHIPIDVDTFHATASLSGSVDEARLFSGKHNLFLIDRDLGDFRINGSQLSNEIREKLGPSIRIVELTGDGRSQNMEGLLEEFKRRQENVIDDTLIKGACNPLDLEETIEKHAFRPLTVSVIGGGNLGRGFLAQFRECPIIRNVNFYSKTEYERDNYEGIKKLLELREYRFECFPSLETALFDTDCVLLCKGRAKLSSEKDRSDLLPQSADIAIMEANSLIRENYVRTGYKGLVIKFDNPVGENLNLMYRRIKNRINTSQLTFPFNLDTDRIINSISIQIKRKS